MKREDLPAAELYLWGEKVHSDNHILFDDKALLQHPPTPHPSPS